MYFISHSALTLVFFNDFFSSTPAMLAHITSLIERKCVSSPAITKQTFNYYSTVRLSSKPAHICDGILEQS